MPANLENSTVDTELEKVSFNFNSKERQCQRMFKLLHNYTISHTSRASLVAQLVKNVPAMQETWVQSLGWKDLLEKRKATHSSILTWRIPWTVQSMGLQSVGHD